MTGRALADALPWGLVDLAQDFRDLADRLRPSAAPAGIDDASLLLRHPDIGRLCDEEIEGIALAHASRADPAQTRYRRVSRSLKRLRAAAARLPVAG